MKPVSNRLIFTALAALLINLINPALAPANYVPTADHYRVPERNTRWQFL